MPKIYSAIEKFKRVELAIRQARSEYSNVINEIEKALTSRRTQEEIILLNSINQQALDLQKQTTNMLANLFDGVEKKK